MIEAVAPLINAGRLKIYCVGSHDGASWSNAEVPLEERARRHGEYESWIIDQVVPWIGGTAVTAARSSLATDRLQPRGVPRGQLRA